MSRPLRAAMVAAETDEGGVVLHDPATGSEHHLNPAAAVIWRLLDGTRDARGISLEVASTFDMSVAAVSADVDATLARFAESRIVQCGYGARPETDLILQCLRVAFRSERRQVLREAVRGEMDWSDVAQTALLHGVAPLVCRELLALPDQAVPAAAVRRLRRDQRINARWSRVLAEELVDLMSAFEAAGIRPVPLKGPLLAAAAYGKVSLRQCGDLDILVRPHEASRAKDVLKASGYRFSASGEADALAARTRVEGTVRIDLQWALGPKRFRFPIDPEGFWERLEPTPFKGATVWQPAPADHVLFLCAHGAKHCWSRLLWIADLAFLTRTYGTRIDWPETLQRARRTGGERVLLLGLLLARDVVGAPAPIPCLARMADRRLASLARQWSGRLFDPPKDPHHFQGSLGGYRGALLYIGTRERLADKLPYLLHTMSRPLRRVAAVVTPTGDDRAFVVLPRHLEFLYYLVRPVRVARKYLTGVISQTRTPSRGGSRQ